MFLEALILQGKVSAPGYINAKLTGNQFVIEAYRKSRFIGANVPHIDPLKEANAERVKLGDAAGAIPLTTVQQATENLNNGDSDANMEQFETELADSIKRKIVAPVKTAAPAAEAKIISKLQELINEFE